MSQRVLLMPLTTTRTCYSSYGLPCARFGGAHSAPTKCLSLGSSSVRQSSLRCLSLLLRSLVLVVVIIIIVVVRSGEHEQRTLQFPFLVLLSTFKDHE